MRLHVTTLSAFVLAGLLTGPSFAQREIKSKDSTNPKKRTVQPQTRTPRCWDITLPTHPLRPMVLATGSDGSFLTSFIILDARMQGIVYTPHNQTKAIPDAIARMLLKNNGEGVGWKRVDAATWMREDLELMAQRMEWEGVRSMLFMRADLAAILLEAGSILQGGFQIDSSNAYGSNKVDLATGLTNPGRTNAGSGIPGFDSGNGLVGKGDVGKGDAFGGGRQPDLGGLRLSGNRFDPPGQNINGMNQYSDYVGYEIDRMETPEHKGYSKSDVGNMAGVLGLSATLLEAAAAGTAAVSPVGWVMFVVGGAALIYTNTDSDEDVKADANPDSTGSEPGEQERNDEQKKGGDQKKSGEQKKAGDQKKKDDQKKAGDQKKRDDQKKKDEQKKRDDQKKADEQKKRDEQKKAEEQKKKDDQKASKESDDKDKGSSSKRYPPGYVPVHWAMEFNAKFDAFKNYFDIKIASMFNADILPAPDAESKTDRTFKETVSMNDSAYLILDWNEAMQAASKAKKALKEGHAPGTIDPTERGRGSRERDGRR